MKFRNFRHDVWRCTFAAVQSGYAVTLYLQPSQKNACIWHDPSQQQHFESRETLYPIYNLTPDCVTLNSDKTAHVLVLPLL